MPLPPKAVTCPCGYASNLTMPKMLCEKCGKYVFYDEKEKWRHRIHSFYGVAMFAAFLTLIVYFFIEMIVNPLFRE